MDVQDFNVKQLPISLQMAIGAAQAQMQSASYIKAPNEVTDACAVILREWRTILGRIMADSLLSNAGKGAAQTLVTDTALGAVADLEIRYRVVLADLQRQLGEPGEPIPAADAMRRWARVERQLAAGVDIQDVLAAADLATVRVMADELPSWNRSRSPHQVAAADAQTSASMALVDARRYELESPANRKRLDLAKATAKGNAMAVTALAYTRHEIAQKSDSVILPTWTGDTVTV